MIWCKKRGLKNILRVREMKKPRRTSSQDVCLLDFGVIGVGNDSWISSTTLGSVILFLSRKSTLYSYQSLLQMNTNSIFAHELIFILNIVNNSAQYTLWHCCRRYVCLAASQILGTHDHKLIISEAKNRQTNYRKVICAVKQILCQYDSLIKIIYLFYNAICFCLLAATPRRLTCTEKAIDEHRIARYSFQNIYCRSIFGSKM